MRPSHPYLRENKKIANNWRHFIISTQTGSHEKSRILLIHFCSNIHSFTVLDYMYTGLYISFKIFILVIYIFIWWLLHTVHIHLIGKVFFLILLTNIFFNNIFTWILLPYLNHYHKLFPKSELWRYLFPLVFIKVFFQQQIFNPLISVLQLYYRYRRT